MLLNEHLPVRNRNSAIYSPLIELCGVTGNLEAAMHFLDEVLEMRQHMGIKSLVFHAQVV